MLRTRRVEIVRTRSGFALVLALSIMAFVLILLISMTLLLQVEATSRQTALSQLRCKENARLALLIAFGDLQRHAGPDQRVSARAEILGDSIPEGNRMWTGVWDSTQTSAPPFWLISQSSATDVSIHPSSSIQIQDGYDQNNNGLYTDGPYEFAPVTVPSIVINSAGDEIAWWISDEGVKAPVQITDTFAKGEPHLDYSGESSQVIPTVHDPAFDLRELVDASEQENPLIESIQRIPGTDSLSILTSTLDEDTRKQIDAQLKHSSTLSNAFVLSNPTDGGLKKDLSFLKTLDPSTTQAELNLLYDDAHISPASIALVQYRANPTAFPTDAIMGMQLPHPTIEEAESKPADFTLAPVISEFQLAAGVAADSQGAGLDTPTNSSLYFVYKVYLELWNPYTIPMRIGDPDLASELGYSDIRVVIKNLPEFTIHNNDSPEHSVQGSLDEISMVWSDSPAAKTLRPGMVFLQTLPTDAYDNNKGAIVEALATTPATINGTRRQSYTGHFTFEAPLEIILYGIDHNSNEREIFTSSIRYPDFQIDYDGDNSATRFKRQLSIQSGATGITKNSIEQPGYAFGFRFKMLDEQEYLGTVHDISDWLSQYDIRNRQIEIDLEDWDIENAWSREPPLPYDFDSSASGYDPSDFDHSEAFKDDDFFTYNSSGGGRMDRIARFIDLPTSEIIDVGIFRSLKYKGYPMNAIGNTWGNDLNYFYDRYFFSTLPAADSTVWNETDPLANPRLTAFKEAAELSGVDTASKLLLANGFNVNACSPLSWKQVLSGKSFAPGDFPIKYEQNHGDFSQSPTWTENTTPLRNVFFNNPQSAIYNLEEREASPRYTFISMANTPDYSNAFRIDNPSWLTQRQHPSFWQSARELTDEQVSELASALAQEIQSYGTEQQRPVFSIHELLSENILSKAIDSVPSINIRQDNADRIPAHTPAHLSSATLMNALGAITFVRSDTFKIKAFARTKDPVTGDLSTTITCEALIQRTPSPHMDPRFGRKFQILNIHWDANTP